MSAICPVPRTGLSQAARAAGPASVTVHAVTRRRKMRRRIIETQARMVSAIARIGDDAAGDKPVPDEQHQQCTERSRDKARALIGTVMTDRLTDPCRDEGTHDAEHGGQDNARRIVRARRQQTRQTAGNESDQNNVEYRKTLLAKNERKSRRLTASVILPARSATVRPA